jgi:hypothetical protein
MFREHCGILQHVDGTLMKITKLIKFACRNKIYGGGHYFVIGTTASFRP